MTGGPVFILIRRHLRRHLNSMSVASLSEKCPYCREPIKAGATRCKHCHADLTSMPRKKSALVKYNTFRSGFLTGTLFTVIILLLVWLQFFSD